MRIRVDHYVHFEDDPTTAAAIARIEALLNQVIIKEDRQMADLARLQTEVAENGDAIASATTLLEGLSQALRDAATDPAAVTALADQLDAQTNALAAAVAANTPADPNAGGGTGGTGEGEPPTE